MSEPEVYVSIDVETDGPAPCVNSMLALGAAAFSAEGAALSSWYSTLHPLYTGQPDSGTMDWWKTQPEAWEEVNTGRQPPRQAVTSFVEWAEALPGRLVAVAWPAAFDFAFVNYYCHRYAGRNPLGFSCLDIRSYAGGLAGHRGYHGLSEEKIREMAGDAARPPGELRPHVAVDDAIAQGYLFMALREHARTGWRV